MSTVTEVSVTASARRKSTMFKKTRVNLIVMYSSLIGCILFIMVLLFYFLLSNTISNSVEEQLNLTSQRILAEWKNNMPSPNKKATYVNYSFIPLNQFFILTSEDGEVLFHSLRDEDLLSFFKSTLAEQQSASKQAQYTTFTFQEDRSFKLFSIENSDKTVLYIGMEVTENANLLSNMKWMLTLFAAMLLLVSIGMGYWFSKRAMVPIQRAYQRQQDFVSDASHELRTPLSIMQASIEILEEEHKKLSSFHQKVLADMKEELASMTRMLEGLLTLARSDSGRLEIIREHFDLSDLTLSTSEAFELLSAQMQIRISCTISNGGPIIFYGDKERIKQLLYILLDNAIKYSKPGGEIQVRLLKKENSVTIQISDTGIGIPQEKIRYIFERFYRIDNGRSRSLGGVGLGLSIAAWIVEAHSGQIKVTSELGAGTMVQIMLPAIK
jgi:signal transduction histidine kinase